MSGTHKSDVASVKEILAKALALNSEADQAFELHNFPTAIQKYRLALIQIKRVQPEDLKEKYRESYFKHLAHFQNHLGAALAQHAVDFENNKEHIEGFKIRRAAITELKLEIDKFGELYSQASQDKDLQKELIHELMLGLLHDEYNLCIAIHTYALELYAEGRYQEAAEQDRAAIKEIELISISAEFHEGNEDDVEKKNLLLAKYQLSLSITLNNYAVSLDNHKKYVKALGNYLAAIESMKKLNPGFLLENDQEIHQKRIEGYEFNLSECLNHFKEHLRDEHKHYKEQVDDILKAMQGIKKSQGDLWKKYKLDDLKLDIQKLSKKTERKNSFLGKVVPGSRKTVRSEASTAAPTRKKKTKSR